jgi:hypothetical protein
VVELIQGCVDAAVAPRAASGNQVSGLATLTQQLQFPQSSNHVPYMLVASKLYGCSSKPSVSVVTQWLPGAALAVLGSAANV